MSMESPIRRVHEEFDWTSLRLPGERVLRAEVERQPDALEIIRRSVTASHSFSGGVRVHPAISPALHRLALILRQVLQTSTEIQFDIVPTVEPIVIVREPSDRRIMTLAISGPLFDHSSLREMLFLCGRRVGQVLLEHRRLSMDPSAGQPNEQRRTLLLRGLWRFQELTADRFGLLCCQDVDIAVSAMIRQSTGLPADLINVSRLAWLSDRPSEEEAMISDSETDFLKLRAAALVKFSESQRYQQAFVGPAIDIKLPASPPRPPVPSPTSTTAPSVAMTVDHPPVTDEPKVVEPVPVSDPQGNASSEQQHVDSESSDERRRFQLHAAFWVLSSLESISAGQRELLKQVFGDGVFEEVRPGFEREGDAYFRRICLAEEASASAGSISSRREALRFLCRLAMTDQTDVTILMPTLTRVTQSMGLTGDDLAVALTDYVDPQFANYPFQPGEAVDVHLDGDWIAGTVEGIDPGSGEIRVRFSASGKALRLHPLSDLIRPRPQRRAS